MLILLTLITFLFSTTSAQVQRDGPVANVSGWDGLTYTAARWEPLCGSLTRTWPPGSNWNGCDAAMNGYSNDVRRTFGLYDRTGVLLERVGVGLGIPLCMCFSLGMIATNENLDICWGFESSGVVVANGLGGVLGSWRISGKALPRCTDANLGSLEAQWSRTAIMPSYTGSVLTFGPSTVTQLRTVTLTPTSQVVPEAGRVTGSGSQGQGSSSAMKLGLGIGISLGILALVVLIWLRLGKQKRITAGKHGDGIPASQRPSYRAPINTNPTWAY
ncbi:hypothetical protein PIIN_07327 [Serendipita indica DSM 11827]|uniref:Uncharacterized protein n=1 Tax=Serendipita indica (strain DSM 11827) TaxID=1109443 RepID=G4TPX6_SERID|nr:hypothetical protein PIIN_07327 [Serendipita indica DSM 11827]